MGNRGWQRHVVWLLTGIHTELRIPMGNLSRSAAYGALFLTRKPQIDDPFAMLVLRKGQPPIRQSLM
jgi:hypothetical protein